MSRFVRIFSSDFVHRGCGQRRKEYRRVLDEMKSFREVELMMFSNITLWHIITMPIPFCFFVLLAVFCHNTTLNMSNISNL